MVVLPGRGPGGFDECTANSVLNAKKTANLCMAKSATPRGRIAGHVRVAFEKPEVLSPR